MWFETFILFGNLSGTFAADFSGKFDRNKRRHRCVVGGGGEGRKNGFYRDHRVWLTSLGRLVGECGRGRVGRRTLNGFDGCWELSGKKENRFGSSIKRVVRDPRDVSPCRPDPGLLSVDVFISFFSLPIFSTPSPPPFLPAAAVIQSSPGNDSRHRRPLLTSLRSAALRRR